ncbi:MAG TPA: hypothetical protein VIY10_04250 [Solirubrobacteraceae bacterium]
MLALVGALAVAAIAAGCGGSAPPSTSSAAQGASGGPGRTAYQFSACMRSHGIANFPDPVVTTSGGSTKVAIAINPTISGQPAFKSAQAACNHILPNGGTGPDGTPAQRQARTQALIAFARCLRAHGFPTFPDPDATGQLSQEMISRAGVNLRTPALLHVGQSCASVTHGQITPTQVAAAINHATASGTQSGSAP